MIQHSLYGLDEPAFIVKGSTGHSYYNQVGGVSCLQRSQEGILIPCHISEEGLGKYGDVFNPTYWYNSGGPDRERLERQIYSLFNDLKLVWAQNVQKIISARIETEAWVECVIQLKEDDGSLIEREAILTWENSD